MTKTDIINYLIVKNGYSTYLEIGLNTGIEYQKIQCENKESVDPFNQEDHSKQGYDLTFKDDIPEYIKKLLTYRMTSDEFFAQNEKTYDIILIDGLHEQQQVARDIINGLKILNDGGMLVIHDCLPGNELMQRVPRELGGWNGDVWKGVAELIKQGLIIDVVDIDWGVGLVKKSDNKDIEFIQPKISKLTWNDFFNNRNTLMHVISKNKFFKKYNINPLNVIDKPNS